MAISTFDQIQLQNGALSTAPNTDPTAFVRNLEFDDAIDPLEATSHAAATITSPDATLEVGGAGQAFTLDVNLSATPGAGQGLLVATEEGLVAQLGTGANAAAAGNHTHPAVTESVVGFMAVADKVKLDGVAAGATNVELAGSGTAATASHSDHTHGEATESVDGFMAAGDKAKLDLLWLDDGAYAPLASPVFTGTPEAPTAAPGNNSALLATTAFVAAGLTAAIASVVGGAPGALETLKELADALGDNVDYAASITNALALKASTASVTAAVAAAVEPLAPVASPAFTGTPTAPTPAGGDNSTNLATTEFVQGAIPPVASEADAQTGTDNAKMMTALAVAEAIAALAPRVANWTSPNRLIDAHAGWKLGDIIYDEGLGGQQVATVTVNSGFPGDGNDHDIEFYFYDTDQAGSSFANGSLYYSALSSDVDQNQLASDLANAISSNIWFVTASATGNVVTITWNNAGTFNNVGGTAYYFYSENEGWGYPAEISDTVVIPGAAPSVSGLYEVVDMSNLSNPNGYAVLLSAIPTPDLSSPGPIGASTPSSANFTTLTVGDGGYGDFPLVATGNIDVNNMGADWGLIRLRATAYGASSYAAWDVGMVGNGYGGTRGTFIIAIDGGDIHFKIDPSSHALFLGVTSTGLMGLLSSVVTYACPSIAANGGTQTTPMNITGATTSSTVIVTPITGNLPAGVIVTGRVTATNTVTLTFTNVTTGAITPPSLQYRAAVFNF